MKEDDALVALIKVMTPSEKRYFKTHQVNHTIGGKHDFVTLFDTVNEQLHKSEQDRDWAAIKVSPAGKKHLYEVLIKALRAYHANRSGQLQFHGLMTDAALLSNKGLYRQAQKRLDKASQLLYSSGLSFERLIVHYTERRLFQARAPQQRKFSALVSLQQEGHRLLSDLERELRIIDHYERLLLAGKTKLKEEKQDRLQEAMSFLAEIPDWSQLSVNARLAAHMIYVFFHKDQHDYAGSAQHRLATIEIFEQEHPNLIEERNRQYLAMINNYLNDCYELKQFDRARERIQSLAKVNSKDPATSRLLRKNLLYAWQQYHLNDMNFRAVLELYPEINHFLQGSGGGIEEEMKIVFHYNTLVAYFLEATLRETRQKQRKQLFDKALDLIFRINQTREFETYTTHITRTRILEAVIRIELSDFNFANSILIRLEGRITRSARDQRKLIRFLKRYISTYPNDTSLKSINSECNTEAWMEELYLWLQKKLNGADHR